MVYKNLHNGKFSIKQDGLVVAHLNSIILSDVSFYVSQSGRNRVIKESKKNVHAFVVGYVKSINTCLLNLKGKRAITYNPYKYSSFVYKDGSSEVHPTESEKVYCSAVNGIYIYL